MLPANHLDIADAADRERAAHLIAERHVIGHAVASCRHTSRNLRSRLLLQLTLVSSIAVLALAGNSAMAAPASLPLSDAPQVRTSGPNTESCWVTGDMVGDANPAVVRAAMCRPH
jgi:hypothetical protein